jgi:hypothetical protein
VTTLGGAPRWPDNDNAQGIVRFPYRVHIVHRRGLERLLNLGRSMGLEVTNQHDGGRWLRCGVITITGPTGNVRMFLKVIDKWNMS